MDLGDLEQAFMSDEPFLARAVHHGRNRLPQGWPFLVLDLAIWLLAGLGFLLVVSFSASRQLEAAGCASLGIAVMLLIIKLAIILPRQSDVGHGSLGGADRRSSPK